MVKNKRHPDAPTRPQPPIFAYTHAVRAQFKADHPEVLPADVTKAISEQWRGLSAEEKEVYEKPYREAQEAYKIAWAAFLESHPDEAPSKKSKKNKEDKGPKKPKSAYLYFSVAVRPDVVKKYPEMPFGDIGKKIGAMWSVMTDEEKKQYSEQAAEDRLRYEQERSVMA